MATKPSNESYSCNTQVMQPNDHPVLLFMQQQHIKQARKFQRNLTRYNFSFIYCPRKFIRNEGSGKGAELTIQMLETRFYSRIEKVPFSLN